MHTTIITAVVAKLPSMMTIPIAGVMTLLIMLTMALADQRIRNHRHDGRGRHDHHDMNNTNMENTMPTMMSMTKIAMLIKGTLRNRQPPVAKNAPTHLTRQTHTPRSSNCCNAVMRSGGPPFASSPSAPKQPLSSGGAAQMRSQLSRSQAPTSSAMPAGPNFVPSAHVNGANRLALRCAEPLRHWGSPCPPLPFPVLPPLSPLYPLSPHLSLLSLALPNSPLYPLFPLLPLP